MNLFIENYAQLFAIAAPILTLAAMNLFLALGGERGTLLLPSSGPLRRMARGVNEVPDRFSPAAPNACANEADFRRAA
ncbi:MAG TPA: hypothetical protein PK042_11440 [Usitatibacteraceae bacterium]|nr:hypothetical protein [Usitatibacteraceae bacterium]